MAKDTEKATHGKITAALEAAGLPSVKCYVNTPPQDAKRPYVVYVLDSQERSPHGGLVNSIVHATAFAAKYDQVAQVVEAIRRVDRSGNELVAGVNLRGMFVENVSDDFEPATDAGETGYRALTVTLRVFVIETNHNQD